MTARSESFFARTPGARAVAAKSRRSARSPHANAAALGGTSTAKHTFVRSARPAFGKALNRNVGRMGGSGTTHTPFNFSVSQAVRVMVSMFLLSAKKLLNSTQLNPYKILQMLISGYRVDLLWEEVGRAFFL